MFESFVKNKRFLIICNDCHKLIIKKLFLSYIVENISRCALASMFNDMWWVDVSARMLWHPTDRIGVHDVFPARAPSSFSGAACRRINIALHNPGSVSARPDPLAYSIGLFLLLNISFIAVYKKSVYKKEYSSKNNSTIVVSYQLHLRSPLRISNEYRKSLLPCVKRLLSSDSGQLRPYASVRERLTFVLWI